MELTGTVVHPGNAEGLLLFLRKPLSFWGGVDPVSGTIADPRHPQHGERLGGRILAMQRTIGSSSSSAIMLELLRNGTAPAAVVVAEPDAILVLGVLVAQELGYPTIPFLQVGAQGVAALARADGEHCTIAGESAGKHTESLVLGYQ